MFTKRDIAKITGLVYLHTVSRLHSKRKAAEELNISIDTLNKYIEDLEADFGVKLLASTGRGSILTPECSNMLLSADKIRQNLREVDTFTANRDNPGGTVRFFINDYIRLALQPYGLGNFCSQYRDVSLHCTCTDYIPNQASLESDVLLSNFEPRGSEMVLIEHRDVRCCLFASPYYVNKYGMPANMDDLLENHRICHKNGMENVMPKWRDILNSARHVVYRTNTLFSLRNAIREGVGISVAPQLNNHDMVMLENVEFESWLPIYLIGHKATKDIPKNRVVLEYIKECMAKLPLYSV